MKISIKPLVNGERQLYPASAAAHDQNAFRESPIFIITATYQTLPGIGKLVDWFNGRDVQLFDVVGIRCFSVLLWM